MRMKICPVIKRVSCFLLSLCLLVALVPVRALAEEQQPRTAAPIGAVTYSGGPLLDSMQPGSVVLTRQDASIPGTLKLSAPALTAGTNAYPWEFIPSDDAYDAVFGTITLTVDHDWTEASCTQAATCRGCGETDGEAPGHTLTYSVSGGTITETCSTPGLEHSGTVQLILPAGASTEYTGAKIEPLQLSYSDSWVGPRDLTISYENNTQIGIASGSVTVGGVTAKVTFEIQPISMEVTAPGLDVTYDGQPHSASVTAPEGATVRYGTQPGSLELTACPAYTDAGDHTVYYQVTKESHRTVEGSFVVKIRPVELILRAGDGEKVYGEEDPETFSWELVSGRLVGSEILTGITVTRSPGEDAGEYAVTFGRSDSNSNYSITFREGTFKILPREITVTWGELTLSYNGKEQAPKATAGNTVFGDKLELTVSGGRTDVTKDQKATATVTGITGGKAPNYKLPGNVTAQFEIKKADLGKPKLRYTDETIDGKKDGTILDVSPDMEYRLEGQESYTPITGTKLEELAPGKYLVRYAESDNCFRSQDTQVVIGPGRKLTVTLPAEQTGYTLTADKTEVSYGQTVVLTFKLLEGCQKGEDFALKVNGQTVTLNADGTCELKDIRGDQTVTVEGILDKEKPTGKIQVGNKVWDALQSGIRFGTFYNAAQSIKITAQDQGSGIDKIHYHLAFGELEESRLESLSNWKEYKSPFAIHPDNMYVIYVRLTDKAGNVSYISSGGLVFDERKPSILGVKDQGVYYTTRKVTAEDNFKLTSFKLDGSTFSGTIPGDPDTETKHTLTAWDAAGNTTTITITMLPVSALEQQLPREEALTLADTETVQQILDTVQQVLQKECAHATQQEKDGLKAVEDKCLVLLRKLEAPAEAAKLLEALPDPMTVQPDDKRAIDALDAAQRAYDRLTDREKEMLDDVERLAALREALTAYKITEGDKAKWTVGQPQSLVFVGNGYYGELGIYAEGAYGKFLGVQVDGELLDPQCYTARSGPTVVALKNSFLETLETGKHTIRLCYIDGETNEATFRISQPIRMAGSGDKAELLGIIFWAVLGLACLVAAVLIILLIAWKKEKD